MTTNDELLNVLNENHAAIDELRKLATNPFIANASLRENMPSDRDLVTPWVRGMSRYAAQQPKVKGKSPAFFVTMESYRTYKNSTDYATAVLQHLSADEATKLALGAHDALGNGIYVSLDGQVRNGTSDAVAEPNRVFDGASQGRRGR
jgi:hypothetical protein